MPSLKTYFQKMKGGGYRSPHPINWGHALIAWVSGFLGIALVGIFGTQQNIAAQDQLFLIGSFGATAVLLYSTPFSPLAQPRHVIGGHLISALVGVVIYQLLPEPIWLASALAVSTSILLMYLTTTTHPPGGATALIAVIGGDEIHALGFWYLLNPVLIAMLLMILVAVLVNNISPDRKYPKYWW
ncbi:MAG: HPP family protein [Arenicellales bacterium]